MFSLCQCWCFFKFDGCLLQSKTTLTKMADKWVKWMADNQEISGSIAIFLKFPVFVKMFCRKISMFVFSKKFNVCREALSIVFDCNSFGRYGRDCSIIETVGQKNAKKLIYKIWIDSKRFFVFTKVTVIVAISLFHESPKKLVSLDYCNQSISYRRLN